jgi:hypothetical protein
MSTAAFNLEPAPAAVNGDAIGIAESTASLSCIATSSSRCLSRNDFTTPDAAFAVCLARDSQLHANTYFFDH